MTIQQAVAGCLFFLVSLVYSGATVAHEVGLSLMTLEVGGGRLVAQLVFDRRDLDTLVTVDADLDGEVSEQESSRARPDLASLAPEILALSVSHHRLWPDEVVVSLQPGGGISFRLGYPDVRGGVLELRSTILRRLPRGHRQHLKVVGRDGAQLAAALLDAQEPSVQIDLMGPQGGSTFFQFLNEGIHHIWMGLDHILFLVTLLLPVVFAYDARAWRPVSDAWVAVRETMKSVTAFTVAHSITLSLAVLGLVSLPERPVEVFIALSVLATALYNLFPLFDTPRWTLAFGFGLLHGFGFASVLQDLGMAPGGIAASLAGFNLGVEAGQLLIVLCAIPLAVAVRRTAFYRVWVFTGGSALAALVSGVWIVERVFNLQIAGF